jgi:hypothetical protein
MANTLAYSAKHQCLRGKSYKLTWEVVKLTGENLKVVWAEFSTLSLSLFVFTIVFHVIHTNYNVYKLKLGPGFSPFA